MKEVLIWFKGVFMSEYKQILGKHSISYRKGSCEIAVPYAKK